LSSKGSAKRGARMTREGKVGASGGASGSPKLSQDCAETMQGASRVPPCPVSQLAAGVAASVRPLYVRGSGRTRRPLVGRRPLPR